MKNKDVRRSENKHPITIILNGNLSDGANQSMSWISCWNQLQTSQQSVVGVQGRIHKGHRGTGARASPVLFTLEHCQMERHNMSKSARFVDIAGTKTVTFLQYYYDSYSYLFILCIASI